MSKTFGCLADAKHQVTNSQPGEGRKQARHPTCSDGADQYGWVVGLEFLYATQSLPGWCLQFLLARDTRQAAGSQRMQPQLRHGASASAPQP